KIAVFAPIASASVTTAMMVNPGVLASVRSAYLKSEIIRIRYNSLGDNDGEHRFHSARRAITGSTRAARRAGSQHAIITAMPSTIAAEMHAIRFGAGISAH